MDEKEIEEFVKMLIPALKELSEEEIRHQADQIEEMTDFEKEQFVNLILTLKKQESQE